jgi:hypothetical protein
LGAGLQVVTSLRAEVALCGAAMLERQGFLDSAREILQQSASSAGPAAAAAASEAKLRLALAQVGHDIRPGLLHLEC